MWSFGYVMYEIWSLGHKVFEIYTNPEVTKQKQHFIHFSCDPGNQAGGQRSPSPSTSWTHERTLQNHDGMLVS